jgi:HlyD family secretion protein
MSLNLRSARDLFVILCVLAVGIVAGILVSRRTQNPNSEAHAASAPPEHRNTRVTALGRLRPGRGVVRVAGPSQIAVVVGKLLVEEGDSVQRGQAIALLDNHAAQKAAVDRLSATVDARIAEVGKIEAELRTGQVEYGRLSKMHQEGAASESQLDVARLTADSAVADLRRARAEIALARAELRQAQEELELTTVRAPVSGRVLKIHAREGEKAGVDGIAEIADTGQMYAVAEVYETDLAMIHVGQHATVTLAAGAPLSGVVERVGLKVGKLDVLGTDPVAKTDARVVEVEVRLDDSARVRNVTNMQVTVSIDTTRTPG